MDLWAREHYKSTIITFALTIQDILNDPEVTIGIFSHTNKIAKGFLRQIKVELESNSDLKEIYPEILWFDPRKEAPKWTEDDGICVRRLGNPKEQTVEAFGLVDGQPTSKHFKLMIYDDVVTRESVTTPEMIANVTKAWELSRNLASEGGRTRYIGTRYHFNDTYRVIMQRQAAMPRVYPATEDGEVGGVPVLMSLESLATKRREMGQFTFAAQMLQDPTADATQGFRPEWLKYQERGTTGDGLNKFILVDPASEKRKTNDYTSAWVLGLGQDQNVYVLDMVRDRLSLTQRADMLFSLHRRWRPLSVGYEKYGMMADIEHFRDRMSRENYTFQIIELGGGMPKLDRIRRMIPWFEQGRILLPATLWKTDYEGVPRELVNAFVEEEYKAFPVSLHDDMLDALARMVDENFSLTWPEPDAPEGDRYSRAEERRRARGSWASV